MLYGAMFLLAGSLLILLLYLLFESRFPTGGTEAVGSRRADVLASIQVDQAAIDERAELVRTALAEQRSAALRSLLEQSLLAFGLVAVSAMVFGWVMAGRVLRPLRHITDTARRVADRRLHERIGLQGPADELKELADTFDAMLERLDGAFSSQQRFVANASHELRTPLTINRTLLEVASTHPDVSPELRQLVSQLLVTNERSERLLDGLLALARSENQAVRQEPVDLSDVAALALEETAIESSAAGVVVDASPEPALTSGDPALLERLALNLVQNGIRHNHRGGRVMVDTALSSQPGWVELVVANTGPVVPPGDVEGLFEPFRRLDDGRGDASRGDASRSGASRPDDGGRGGDLPGVGLGLSIVRSVVRTHGGEIQASARSGGGLVVRVRLPASPPGAERVSPSLPDLMRSA